MLIDTTVFKKYNKVWIYYYDYYYGITVEKEKKKHLRL